jgi:hypothetical protein
LNLGGLQLSVTDKVQEQTEYFVSIMVNNLIYQEPFQPNLIWLHSRFNSYYDAIYFSDYKMVSQELFVLLIFAGTEKIFFSRENSASYCMCHILALKGQ